MATTDQRLSDRELEVMAELLAGGGITPAFAMESCLPALIRELRVARAALRDIATDGWDAADRAIARAALPDD